MFDRVPRSVSVDGVEVAYHDVGSGEPLVFVHGYFLSARTWRKVIPALAATRRCIAVDLLGAGNTAAPPDADFSIPAQVRMLEGFLDVLDLPSATLVAHDSGAVVARALAARRPERAAGLVLSDTELPHLAVPSAHRLQKLFSLPGGARAFEMLLGSRFFWRHVLARSAISDRAAFDVEEFVATHLAPLASREKRRASRRFALQWDLGFVDALPHERLTMPKLVLWGDRDAFVSLARARDFYDALPGPKEFARIARCGTLPHEERPDAWVASVRAFLDLGRADDRMPASS